MNINCNSIGIISPASAWEALTSDQNVCLLDVRTPEEWQHVGIPLLSSLQDRLCLVAWRYLPDMRKNDDFIEDVARVITAMDTTILLLCRSGVRSYEAAVSLVEYGYANCYNIEHGFEGDVGSDNQRGYINGWKASDLPWRLYDPISFLHR